jgi:hypothetical protein
MILSASRLVLFSFHPELYAIPHPKPAGTVMLTADIPVGPLLMDEQIKKDENCWTSSVHGRHRLSVAILVEKKTERERNLKRLRRCGMD